MGSRFWGFALGPILVVAIAGPAAAELGETATPAPVVAEDPARCRVEPRSVEELEQLARAPRTPDHQDASDEVDLDRSTPADAETLASIAAMLREFVACGNGGDWLRLLALTTDDFIRTELNIQDLIDEPMAPMPRSEWLAFVELRDALRLADGRVVAVVVVTNPAEPEDVSPAVLIFDMVDGRWLIDGDLDPAEREDLGLDLGATPAAAATAAT